MIVSAKRFAPSWMKNINARNTTISARAREFRDVITASVAKQGTI